MVIFTIVCCHGNSLHYSHINDKEIQGVLPIFTVNATSLNPKLKQIAHFQLFILLKVYVLLVYVNTVGSHLKSLAPAF